MRNFYINSASAFLILWIIRTFRSEQKLFLQQTLCLTATIFALLFLTANISEVVRGQAERSEFFLNDNLASSFILLAFFLTLGLFLGERQSVQQKKWYYMVPLILTSASFYFTKSLSGLSGALVGICYLSWPQRNKRIALSLAALILIFAGIAFQFAGEYGQRSVVDRWRWWSESVGMLSNRPFFGYGPGSFETISSYFSEPGLKSIYAHSFPLQLACEIGLPAALFLFLFIFGEIRKSANRFFNAGLLAVLLQNLFDFSLNIPGFFILFIAALAIAGPDSSVAIIPEKVEPKPVFFQSLRPVLAGTGGTLLFLILGATAWYGGVKPLLAIQESFRAQDAFRKGDSALTEKHLRNSLEWDNLPAKTYTDLSLVLSARYLRDRKEPALLKEALTMQIKALGREPWSREFGNRLHELMKIAEEDKIFRKKRAHAR